MNKVIIVGAGISGLFASYKLLEAGLCVDLYDHSSGVGKKFLVAGKGGLNLTHSEDLSLFLTKYNDNRGIFESMLDDFSPNDLIAFCNELGVETFTGSSGRVFPKELSAAKMLINWGSKLKENSRFRLFLNHALKDITLVDDGYRLDFFDKQQKKQVTSSSNIVALGLGGKSWKKTGSDGGWVSLINKLNIKTSPFEAMNCGQEIDWGESLKNITDYYPLKNVSINGVKGELMITPFGVEGSLVYAHSKKIQTDILNKGSCILEIDLRPDMSINQMLEILKTKREKDSRGNHLRKCLKLNKVESLILKDKLSKDDYFDDKSVCTLLKGLKLELLRARPLDEAISTSGGVKFSEVNKGLESKLYPGLYFMGEMLDWDAPTGGYLFQGCFSSAYRVVKSILS
jgi:uncharacterized flavoprotein (TIGR03862 family)